MYLRGFSAVSFIQHYSRIAVSNMRVLILRRMEDLGSVVICITGGLIDGLVQERCNSVCSILEILQYECILSSICSDTGTKCVPCLPLSEYISCIEWWGLAIDVIYPIETNALLLGFHSMKYNSLWYVPNWRMHPCSSCVFMEGSYEGCKFPLYDCFVWAILRRLLQIVILMVMVNRIFFN